MLDFQGPQPRCFGAPAASSVPLEVGDFTGRVVRGASCNCSTVTLTPHANGTHTESVGHLTVERVDVHSLVPQRLLLAALLTVEPELAADSRESSEPAPADADLLITRARLEEAWPAPLASLAEGERARGGDPHTAQRPAEVHRGVPRCRAVPVGRGRRAAWSSGASSTWCWMCPRPTAAATAAH